MRSRESLFGQYVQRHSQQNRQGCFSESRTPSFDQSHVYRIWCHQRPRELSSRDYGIRSSPQFRRSNRDLPSRLAQKKRILIFTSSSQSDHQSDQRHLLRPSRESLPYLPNGILASRRLWWDVSAIFFQLPVSHLHRPKSQTLDRRLCSPRFSTALMRTSHAPFLCPRPLCSACHILDRRARYELKTALPTSQRFLWSVLLTFTELQFLIIRLQTNGYNRDKLAE